MACGAASEKLLGRAKPADEDPDWIDFFTYARLAADATEIHRDLAMPHLVMRFEELATMPLQPVRPLLRGAVGDRRVRAPPGCRGWVSTPMTPSTCSASMVMRLYFLPTKTTVWSVSAWVESPRGRTVMSHAAGRRTSC